MYRIDNQKPGNKRKTKKVKKILHGLVISAIVDLLKINKISYKISSNYFIFFESLSNINESYRIRRFFFVFLFMENRVYIFGLKIDWNLIRMISQIDRFDASWSSIEKKEGSSLKQLKTIATIRSVGASTRIEGSNMSDKEIEALLNEN